VNTEFWGRNFLNSSWLQDKALKNSEMPLYTNFALFMLLIQIVVYHPPSHFSKIQLLLLLLLIYRAKIL